MDYKELMRQTLEQIHDSTAESETRRLTLVAQDYLFYLVDTEAVE